MAASIFIFFLLHRNPVSKRQKHTWPWFKVGNHQLRANRLTGEGRRAKALMHIQLNRQVAQNINYSYKSMQLLLLLLIVILSSAAGVVYSCRHDRWEQEIIHNICIFFLKSAIKQTDQQCFFRQSCESTAWRTNQPFRSLETNRNSNITREERSAVTTLVPAVMCNQVELLVNVTLEYRVNKSQSGATTWLWTSVKQEREELMNVQLIGRFKLALLRLLCPVARKRWHQTRGTTQQRKKLVNPRCSCRWTVLVSHKSFCMWMKDQPTH